MAAPATGEEQARGGAPVGRAHTDTQTRPEAALRPHTMQLAIQAWAAKESPWVRMGTAAGNGRPYKPQFGAQLTTGPWETLFSRALVVASPR